MIVEKKHNLWKYIVGLVLCIIYLIPLYVLSVISFKPMEDTSSYWVFSKTPTLENLSLAFIRGDILSALLNTLLITVASVFLIVLVGSLTAYPLARKKTKLTSLIRNFSLGIMMVPPLTILVPLYATLVSYHGVNTYWGLVITLLTFELPLSIFLYTNFIKAIPVALDEAAEIDGAGPIRTFYQIILPQLKSVTVSVVILSGIHCWNDYQFSLYIMQKKALRTVTLAIASFFSQDSSNLNAAAAGALIVILPVILIFIFLQKYFIKGMVDSAIK
ncbi:MAG: carbohydrate ABC transporter permease [Clostridiales bacterium]|nr:carbohydrate ABC transporter permease [Clostridiales bacterium]